METHELRIASSITSVRNSLEAADELLRPIGERVTPGMVDLALLFTTAHFEDELPQLLDRIGSHIPGAVITGCTAEGTIGCDQELERTPSMSILAASLPDVDLRPFHVGQGDLDGASTALDWERIVGVSAESRPVFIAFADPFGFAVQDLVEQINEAYAGAPLVGGIASAARLPKENRLFLNGEIYREGSVGVALSGRLAVDTVVSQGCRPIGKPFVITRAERNIIHELGGRPPLAQLQDVLDDLSAEERRLVRDSLLLGRVIDEYKDRFAHGDFLIQNLLGADRQSGAMAIAGQARIGSTVQFHVRDAASADEDLRAMLAAHADKKAQGAALFGCNGRGTHMWSQPGHDVRAVRELLGKIPVAGFFCAGEFGPIGGTNFIHGFTASIALFREPDGPAT